MSSDFKEGKKAQGEDNKPKDTVQGLTHTHYSGLKPEHVNKIYVIQTKANKSRGLGSL